MIQTSKRKSAVRVETHEGEFDKSQTKKVANENLAIANSCEIKLLEESSSIENDPKKKDEQVNYPKIDVSLDLEKQKRQQKSQQPSEDCDI